MPAAKKAKASGSKRGTNDASGTGGASGTDDASGTSGTGDAGGTSGTGDAGGTSAASGTDGVSRDALKQLVSGHAKVARSSSKKGRAMPWERHDPDASPDKAMNFRTNAYDRALLKYVAGLRGQSAQLALRDMMRQAALAEAKE